MKMNNNKLYNIKQIENISTIKIVESFYNDCVIDIEQNTKSIEKQNNYQ
jgi:hypothetical protein